MKKLLFILFVIALLSACARSVTPPPTKIILATTTSTQDSGLLDVLIPRFTAETKIPVDVIAVGSGAAIEMGKNGEADVMLTHSPAAEKEFIQGGFGLNIAYVMENDFILVGRGFETKLDTANIVGIMSEIYEKQYNFISRGDKSGTHSKELTLWKAANLSPSGSWYIEAAAGMGAVLTMADEKSAVTLSDRSTYLSMKDKLSLNIVSEGATELANPYSVITVNPKNGKNVNENGARVFYDWILSDSASEIITSFGADKYAEPLFFIKK